MVSKESLKKMYNSGEPRLMRKAVRRGYEPEGNDSQPQEDLSSSTVDELKDKLREAGKKVSGTKDELIERLKE